MQTIGELRLLRAGTEWFATSEYFYTNVKVDSVYR